MIATYRHELPLFMKNSGNGNGFHLNMHAGASIIHVAEIIHLKEKLVYESTKKERQVYLWSIEDSSFPVERRDFRYITDGERLDFMGDEASWRHVATFCGVGGHHWTHIFEVTGIALPREDKTTDGAVKEVR